MNLNLNPKILHVLLEIVQIGGALGAAQSVVGTFNPIAGTVCGVAGAVATYIKSNVIGNIPPAS